MLLIIGSVTVSSIYCSLRGSAGAGVCPIILPSSARCPVAAGPHQFFSVIISLLHDVGNTSVIPLYVMGRYSYCVP